MGRSPVAVCVTATLKKPLTKVTFVAESYPPLHISVRTFFLFVTFCNNRFFNAEIDGYVAVDKIIYCDIMSKKLCVVIFKTEFNCKKLKMLFHPVLLPDPVNPLEQRR